MRNVLLILFLVAIVSCKNEEKTTKSNTVKKEGVAQDTSTSNRLILEIDLETSVPEDMKLIATNIFLNNGQFMDIYVSQRLNANERSKSIRFELPNGVVPDFNLGISFGTQKLKEVKIKRIKLSFSDQIYTIDPQNIMTFFKTNKYVDYEETSGIFKTKRVNNKHNPILFLRKPYLDKIQGI